MMAWQDENGEMGERDVVMLTIMASPSGAVDTHGMSLWSFDPHGPPLTKSEFWRYKFKIILYIEFLGVVIREISYT